MTGERAKAGTIRSTTSSLPVIDTSEWKLFSTPAVASGSTTASMFGPLTSASTTYTISLDYGHSHVDVQRCHWEGSRLILDEYVKTSHCACISRPPSRRVMFDYFSSPRPTAWIEP